MGAWEDANLHAEPIEDPKVHMSQQGRNRRARDIVEERARRGEREGGINRAAEQGGEKHSGPEPVDNSG